MRTACSACRKRTRCRSKLQNFRSDLSHIFSFCILLLVHHGSSTTSARRCLFLEGLFGTMALWPVDKGEKTKTCLLCPPGLAHCDYSAEFGCCQSSFDSSWTDLNKTATLTNHIGRRWAKALTTNNGFWQARWNGIAKWRHRKIFYIHRETASCSHQEQASTKREKAKGRKELFVSLYHIHVIVIFAIDSSRLRKHGKVQRQLEIFLRGRLLDESRPLYCLSSSLKTPHPSCLYNFEPLISWENLWKMIMSRKVVKNH